VIADERRDAARSLLNSPLVLAARDPQGHREIRRHADHLRTMFRNYLGYRLVVDAGFARLFKAGLGPGNGRPLLRSSKRPFSPRDYTYLALLCSVLITSRRQILLSSVVADIRQAAAEADVELGGDTLTERRALVHALRQLIEWGVVTEDAGDVAAYADDPSNEALLWVESEILRHLLAVSLREVDDPAELVRLAASTGPEAVRHAVRRKVVECPVVMADELPDQELAWLRQYQRREAQILEDNVGLRLEIRSEGVAALDPQDQLTDMKFPREGSLGQAALLAAAELVAELDAGSLTPAAASVPVPPGLLATVVDRLLATYGHRWSKEYVGNPDRLAPEVEDLLVDMGLLARSASGDLALRAVAARYAPEPAEIGAPVALRLTPMCPT
jgi:uncharacterized protein (TIGR02678 family)